MTKLVLFVGTPGAGKSTLLSIASEHFNGNLRIVNLGDEFLKIAKTKYNIKDREALGTMSNTDTLQLREAAFQHIIEAKTDAIIDTHLSIKNGRRYIPGITMPELEKIRVRAIIYIDATAEEIWNRRHKDSAKQHRRNIDDTLIEIEEQRGINLSILSSCAIYLSIPIYIVNNAEGQQEAAVNEIIKIIKEQLGTGTEKR